jgi:hypothetical protein
VQNQLVVSGDPTKAPVGAGHWSTAPTSAGINTPPYEAGYFNGFFHPSWNVSGDPKTYYNTQLTIQAPYTPTRTVFSTFLLQANDPLVHYLGSDLNSQYGTLAVWSANNSWKNGVWNKVDTLVLPTPPPIAINSIYSYPSFRYQPWGVNKQMAGLSGVDTNAFNLAYRDPLAWWSDGWDFPTNLYPTAGWIGRVHRGTPWQTVDLKSTNIITYTIDLATSGIQNIGSNTWANWTGNIQRSFDEYFDAMNSAPMQDRFLFDIFTARLNDNSVRGTLPVNQTHLAAWSALFSGMVVLSNSTVNTWSTINPAGVMDPSLPYQLQPPLWQIVNGPFGINATRANQNLFPSQAFTHVGDVLQTPAFSEYSPFLNHDDLTSQRHFGQADGMSDELYEWLPQQMMGLVRLGEPRFVLYAYGQALRPAPNGTVLSSTTLASGLNPFGLVTNYQVVAESAVRAVIRVDNATSSKPHAVVESYNVLPPN